MPLFAPRHDVANAIEVFFVFSIGELIPATLMLSLFWKVPKTQIAGFMGIPTTSPEKLPQALDFNNPQRYDFGEEPVVRNVPRPVTFNPASGSPFHGYSTNSIN